jgi:hypothetical protein
MAANSMIKVMLDWPVPVTAFNQMVEADIKSRAIDTILKTGIPSVRKPSP